MVGSKRRRSLHVTQIEWDAESTAIWVLYPNRVVPREANVRGLTFNSRPCRTRVFLYLKTMIIYHIVPKRYFDKQDPKKDYTPKPFAKDGFIHCTKEAGEMAKVANRFYIRERGPHVYLYIDTRKVKARIKYEDNARKYPHIYGGLNRDAVVAIKTARRSESGRFLKPEPLGEG